MFELRQFIFLAISWIDNPLDSRWEAAVDLIEWMLVDDLIPGCELIITRLKMLLMVADDKGLRFLESHNLSWRSHWDMAAIDLVSKKYSLTAITGHNFWSWGNLMIFTELWLKLLVAFLGIKEEWGFKTMWELWNLELKTLIAENSDNLAGKARRERKIALSIIWFQSEEFAIDLK